MSQSNAPNQSDPFEQSEARADRHLDEVSEDDLSRMLGEAERALRDIREELRERRAMAHAGIEMETPRQDLNEARGRWSYFFEFVRQLSAHDDKRHTD